MSRKRKSSSFSFTKFFDAVVPNLFEDVSTRKTANLGPLRRDMLYSHQLASQDFFAIGERSFFVAGVVEEERTSKKTYKALQNNEIIKADGKVDIKQIGPRFLHQVPFLDAYRQRELVNLLFWWAEECQRFAKLIGEDSELTAMIAEAEQHAAEDPNDSARKEMVDQVKFARERVRMKIRQRPSERQAKTEANTDDIMDRFRGNSLAMQVPSQVDRTATKPDEPLPSYYVVGGK